MPDCTLQRFNLTPTATFGVLTRDDTGETVAVTVEREWDGGSNRKSTPERPGACIPPGTYTCVKVKSPKFGDTYEVTKVPTRSAILLHSGNLADDSRGCIILGSAFGTVKGKDGVVGSKLAMGKFLAMQANVQAFTLTIRNPEPA